MKVVVLGAGFGGLTAATELARGGADVTLVDERESFLMGLAKLQVLDGRRRAGDGARRLADVERSGARFLRASVEAIDVGARRVATSGGALAYDHLVVALGARLGSVPTGARNLYSVEGVEALHRDLEAMRDGGRLLIAVSSMPFKCPPAPYEAAMLAKAFLDARGVRASVTIASPEPQPLPVAGAECGTAVRGWLEDRGVEVRNGTPLSEALKIPHDVLAVVPPHEPPAAVRALAGESGWLPVDAATLATRHERVWGAGDCTVVKLANGKPLVKAGIIAEGEARVVARRILGDEGARFDGKGGCFLELGRGEAVEVQGDFYAQPDPVVAAGAPSKAALAKKETFERERLERWFGPARGS